MSYYLRKVSKLAKGYHTEAVNQRRTESTTIYKTLLRKLKMEQLKVFKTEEYRVSGFCLTSTGQ
jgi:hypothetical protein